MSRIILRPARQIVRALFGPRGLTGPQGPTGAPGADAEIGTVWKDLIGDINPKASGVGRPTLGPWDTNVRGWHYTPGDDGDAFYHMPHDWSPGTDLFLHLHWGHNGTAISGNLRVRCFYTYAKGHNQAAYFSEKTIDIEYTGLNLTNCPQRQHMVTEVQLTAAAPDASQFATSLLEPDGCIRLHFDVIEIPTISGGLVSEPFLDTLDIHYQADRVGTPNRTPDFYSIA